MNVKTIGTLTVGVLIGTALTGPLAQAAETWFRATPSTQSFYADGRAVSLEAYAINGHNYVKLRDIGQAVGFDVAYDPTQNAVLIGASGGNADRADGLNLDDPRMAQALSSVSRWPIYEITAQPDGGKTVTARYPEAYRAAADHTRPFVDGLEGLPNRQKVEAIAGYVCDRLRYALKYPSPGKVLAQDGQLEGCCMAYAYSFQFLCNRADIPCILIQNPRHQWNQVYVEGQWWAVDLTGDDSDDPAWRAQATILHRPEELMGSIYEDASPEVTELCKKNISPLRCLFQYTI